MNRTDFQELAELRLKEAEALLLVGCWDGAYYLAGYAVECGLKACVANLFRTERFPTKEFGAGCYTHSLPVLRKLAGLDGPFQTDAPLGSQLEKNWTLAIKWNEAVRYDRKTKPDADELIDAINHSTDGVLTWIKKYW